MWKRGGDEGRGGERLKKGGEEVRNGGGGRERAEARLCRTERKEKVDKIFMD
jgi:hypothetical protein